MSDNQYLRDLISSLPQVAAAGPEPIYVLRGEDIMSLLIEGVQMAIGPMIEDLDSVKNKMIANEAAFESFKKSHTSFAVRTSNEIDQLFAMAEKKSKPRHKDSEDILRAILAANGGKMLLKDARQKMHMNKPRFSELLSNMGDYIETKPYHLNKSAKILMLK